LLPKRKRGVVGVEGRERGNEGGKEGGRYVGK